MGSADSEITGPLIRIVGDKFPGNVKKAIVDTLQALLIRGGPGHRNVVTSMTRRTCPKAQSKT